MIQRLLTPGSRGLLLAFALLLGLSFAAVWQLPDLKLDRSDERLISSHDPGWAALREQEKYFGGEQSVLVYLRARDLWTTPRLLAIQKAGFAMQDTPGITSVKSLLSATNIRDKGHYVDAGPLVDVVPKTAKELAVLRDDALYSPIIRGNFLSDDGQATAITITYSPDKSNPEYELEMYRTIEHLVEPLREHFDIVFQIGWPRLNHEIDRGVRDDMVRIVPIAAAILVVVMTIFLRAPRVIPIPLITAAITTLWTFGFMAAVGIPVTMLTAILPALIIVVGSVEDVHLIASYLDGIEPFHADLRRHAIAHMAHHVGTAILITSALNILGFASNIITSIPLIREFSLAATFAMAANLVVTLLAMPLLLHVLGPRRNRLRAEGGMPAGFVGMVVRTVESLSAHHAKAVVAAVIAVVLLLGAQIGQIKVNNDPMAYFHPQHAFVQDARRVHNDLAGVQTFGVILRASQPGWFKTVEGLRTISDVQTLLNGQGLYDKTTSLADLMSLMHQEMHKGDRAYHVVPSRQEDFDLYLSDMPRSEIANFVTEDFSTAQITVRHNVADSIQLNAAIDHLQTVLPAVVGERATFAFAGKNLMANRAAESLIDGQLQSLALILTVIFALFSVLYTSWLAGLLALVPNLLPIVLNFGVMAWLGVPLNPGTAMVAAIAIGLAVDDTIHLMTRFGAESRRLVDENAAVRATIRGEAVPVLTTAVALALGFAVFGLSNFRIVAQFGLLAAGTMVYAAISDLLLMPILLKHLRLATLWDIIALEVDHAVIERCPLFAGMTEYQSKQLILLSDRVEFQPGQTLMRQGELSSGMFMVLKGRVEILIEKDGQPLKIDDGRPGDIFGEAGFAGTHVARTATVRAVSAVATVRIESDRVDKGLRFYPRIAARLYRNISAILGSRLLDSHQRLLLVSSDSSQAGRNSSHPAGD